MKKIRKIIVLVLSICLVTSTISSNVATTSVKAAEKSKTLKILAIGNSFSQDAHRWLYQVAKAAGYEDIIVANLYWGGCSLWQHWSNAQSDYAGYEYQKNTTGDIQYINNVSIKTAVTDEDWDYITLQQVSGYSGLVETYNSDLTNLASYVKQYAKNPNMKLGWHMTWAYQSDSWHGDFSRYGNDQMTMYNSIVNAVQSKVSTNKDFSFVIPAGTAIQNLRTSFIGDTLTRDGYHLSYNLGRYVAALTWIYKICDMMGLGFPTNITYTPDNSEVPQVYLPVIREAVMNSIRNPFSVVKSSYTTASSLMNSYEYTELDWQPQCYGYWNSTDANAYDKITYDSDISKNYIASGVRFDRNQLPAGSVIMVQNGYQYRPEGWAQLGQKNPYNRPDYVSKNEVIVTTAWWGQYNYRGFNLYKTDGSIYGVSADQAKSILKIYVPKNSANGNMLPVDRDFVIKSKSSGKALAVSNNSRDDLAGICQMSATGAAEQVWTLQDAGNGYYYIVNKVTGKALDVPGSSTEQGKEIIQYGKNNGENQKWKIEYTGDGYYRISPKLVERFALDVSGNSHNDGAKVLQWEYQGAENQKWKFEIITESPQLNKEYVFKSKLSGKALSVANGSYDNLAPICQMTLTYSAEQVWTLKDAGNGYYYIVNKLSGKALDVPGGSAEEGKGIIQYSTNNGDNQKWKLENTGDGYYRISPKNSGNYALDVEARSLSNGASVIQWTYGGADNQKWELKSVN